MDVFDHRGFQFSGHSDAPIGSSSEMDALSSALGSGAVHLPDMTHPRNFFELRHRASGFRLRVDALGALRCWHAQQTSRIGAPINPTAFDWTPRAGAAVARIPLERLRQRDPILFYQSFRLYADELHDRGIVEASAKVRVMDGCLLVLVRTFLRLDHERVWLRDARWFLSFGDGHFVKDVQLRICDMAELRRMLGAPDLSSYRPGRGGIGSRSVGASKAMPFRSPHSVAASAAAAAGAAVSASASAVATVASRNVRNEPKGGGSGAALSESERLAEGKPEEERSRNSSALERLAAALARAQQAAPAVAARDANDARAAPALDSATVSVSSAPLPDIANLHISATPLTLMMAKSASVPVSSFTAVWPKKAAHVGGSGQVAAEGDAAAVSEPSLASYFGPSQSAGFPGGGALGGHPASPKAASDAGIGSAFLSAAIAASRKDDGDVSASPAEARGVSPPLHDEESGDDEPLEPLRLNLDAEDVYNALEPTEHKAFFVPLYEAPKT